VVVETPRGAVESVDVVDAPGCVVGEPATVPGPGVMSAGTDDDVGDDAVVVLVEEPPTAKTLTIAATNVAAAATASPDKRPDDGPERGEDTPPMVGVGSPGPGTGRVTRRFAIALGTMVREGRAQRMRQSPGSACEARGPKQDGGIAQWHLGQSSMKERFLSRQHRRFLWPFRPLPRAEA